MVIRFGLILSLAMLTACANETDTPPAQTADTASIPDITEEDTATAQEDTGSGPADVGPIGPEE